MDNQEFVGMELQEFLLHHTEVGEYIVFTEGGWQIGCTWIDHEDLFIKSLNPTMLDKTVVDIKRETDSILGMIKATYVEIYRKP